MAQVLDQAVAAFHRRPLANHYRALVLDGVVLSRQTGGGALRRPVLVPLGITPAGRKEAIDFRLAPAQSRCLAQDLETLLEFPRFDDPAWRRATRTTNVIECRFREVRRRTR